MDAVTLIFLILLSIFTALIFFLVRKNQNMANELQQAGKLEKEIGLKNQQEISSLKKEIELLTARMAEEQKKALEERNEFQKKEQVLNQRILELSTKAVQLESEKKALIEKLETQKEEIEKIQQKFQVEFKNLANEIFEEKSKKFNDQNKENIDQILKPLGEKIKDFEKKVEETYDKESKLRFSLKEEVRMLHEQTQRISKEATDLTRALKGQTKTMGNWGEVILENILEKSGLQRDREYFVQPSYTNEGGKRVQPDVVIRYPGNKHVIVDSKVSLVAYERYVNADEAEKQEQFLKEHLQSVRKHIQELSAKSYENIPELGSLDFTMMFMPVEPAYLLAVGKDPELWNFAYEKRIILIGPTNLVAALKLVENLWQQEYQSRNVAEIARQSGALYDKFVGLLEDLQSTGKKIDEAATAHRNSLNKLSTGRGNLVSRVEKIKQLGARTKKEIPSAFLGTNDEEE